MNSRARITYFCRMLVDAFLHSSPYVQRVLLTVMLLTTGISFALTHNWEILRTLAAHRMVASQQVWASAYLLLGVLCAWRLLDPQPRVFFGVAINGCVFVLLITSSLLLWASGAPFACLAGYASLDALWVLLRTGATYTDKARA